ncbi:hypothetical protein DOTSEDRAFT_33342 [Dothistroma septosporum NZE10]|uniref:Peroxidase n=1 Tax=Dothistroma septosporum (strain NZE10 / CBS 128990) TaxID=675120 RepID=N1PTK9_DOTSN|nr:hypothetical protein DOTSEDRAFT_33342 [Dothistroma septosporum NZE10]
MASTLLKAGIAAAIFTSSIASAAVAGQKRGSSSSCPAIWSQVASQLKRDFNGCNDLARSAIRFAFHDAAGYSSSNPQYAPASGGADGSLLLNDVEVSRSTETPMKQKYRDPYLLPLYQKYKSQGVGAADLVQFAGAVGIKSCPGGPTVKTVVGRIDSSTAAPQGTLPAAFGQGSDYNSLIQLWAAKGISPRELAALMGAHTVSMSFTNERYHIPPGGPQDSDPTVWDNNYFIQTQSQSSQRQAQNSHTQGNNAHSGVYSFDSDVNLSNATTECGQAFTEFANNLNAWNAEFPAAMQKMSLFGIDQGTAAGFVDCTSLIS